MINLHESNLNGRQPRAPAAVRNTPTKVLSESDWVGRRQEGAEVCLRITERTARIRERQRRKEAARTMAGGTDAAWTVAEDCTGWGGVAHAAMRMTAPCRGVKHLIDAAESPDG